LAHLIYVGREREKEKVEGGGGELENQKE